ncbi:MAG: hypothetical protein AAFR87_11050 [Bacteroidota bacterium]
MKKLINIFSLCLISICLSATNTFGQAVFNDTILFKINGIEQVGNAFKYFLEFETQGTGPGNPDAFRGIGVLSMCSCYCDSIWDAWPASPPPDDSLFTGVGVITYPSTTSSGGNGGLFKSSSSGGRQRGRLGVLQMPGSFLRQDPFPLQITYKEI